MSQRVVVVGAGISGLAAAYRVNELAPEVEVTILEADSRPGGVLRTTRQDGFLIEESADSFITTMPGGIGLCRRLGLEDQIIPTDPDRRRAFVVSRGRLVPIPDGLMIMAPSRLRPMLTTPILSPLGKLRMGMEAFIRPGSGDDESLESFAIRRFGREAYERLIQPLVGGMYTGDPARLGVKATMPRFLEMERTHGSLIRAALKERATRGKSAETGSGARYGLFVGLKDGMSSLVDALVRKLPTGSLRCGVRVEALERSPGSGWVLRLGGDSGGAIEADAVIVATPARHASGLLAGVDGEIASRLASIPSTSSAIVSLGYRREQIAHPLDGFGFVVPHVEGRRILSGSFSSVKFPGRAPDGKVLLRAFLGGAFRPEIVDQDDQTLVEIARDELSSLLGIDGRPIIGRVSRWHQVMPQYEVGHPHMVAAMESRIDALPGLGLAGNAYGGVGVPQCIRSGETAAEKVVSALNAHAGRATASGVEIGS